MMNDAENPRDGVVSDRAEDGILAEQAPTNPESKPQQQSRRYIWIGIGMLVLTAAIVGITVGLTQRNNGDEVGATTSDGDFNSTFPGPTSPTNPNETVDDEETFYRSTSAGVFNVTLPLFSSSVSRGYTEVSELEHDLIEACKFKVNLIIEQSEMYTVWPTDEETFADGDKEQDDLDAAAPTGGSGPSAAGVDDFETNVQEEGVDEGDMLKTNGVHAFAAYGEYVVVWEVASGRFITNITLPPIDGSYQDELPFDVIDEQAPGGEETTVQSDSGAIAGDSFYFNPKPYVQSLLLHDDKLVVVAGGYGPSFQDTMNYTSVFYDAYNTNIRIYDISQLATTDTVTLVKETNVHGSFYSARAIGNKVHLVTFAGINTYDILDGPLARWQPQFQNLSDVEYRDAAKQFAEDELIPKFVQGIIRDLTSDGELADIARVSMWQSQASTDRRLEEQVFSQGILNSFGQVISFDISSESDELGVTRSGVLMPSGWGNVYATEKMLVIFGSGWNWFPGVGGSVATTYLHGFALLEDGRATPAAVGTLKGELINNYAVDIVDDYMRVATTIRNDMWVFEAGIEEDVVDSSAATSRQQPVPRTENYVIVFKIPEADGSDPAVFNEVGRTESLGKDGETFFGVRFADKVAYVVTFEQTDPFYVIAFDDPEQPEVLGELSITGFSTYLHFINKENTLILGVGQDADTDGRTLGVQVSLYNAEVPTDPMLIDRYRVEVKDDVYSSSTAEWDFMAFRYVALGDDYGILIIPLRIDSYTSSEGNFDGFILLDINSTSVSERFNISHVDSESFRTSCYYHASLPERSFVKSGIVTTTKGHSIRLHDLDSSLRTGGIDVDDNLEEKENEDDICYYW